MPRRKAKRVKKISSKTHRIRKSSGDLVQIQIIAKLFAVPKGFRPTKALIEEFIREKALASSGEWSHELQTVVGAKEGPNPPGIKLSITKWSNPDRLADEDTGWRYANPDSPYEQAQAWGSLRRIIQTARLHTRTSR